MVLSYNIGIAIEAESEMKKMRVVQMSSNEGISYLVEHKVLGLFWYREGYELRAGQHSLAKDLAKNIVNPCLIGRGYKI